VADTHPDGATRGLVRVPNDKKELLFEDGMILQLMRTLPSEKTHQGMIEIPPRGGVAEGLMTYMQISEQVVSFVAVSTVIDNEQVQAAGGYIVQLLPEVETGPLAVMAERLADFEPLDSLLRRGEASPDTLLSEVLYRMPYTRLEERPVRFGCQCSHVRVVLSLSTLSTSDIEELVAPGEVIEVGCEYCGRTYSVTPAQLRGLLQKS
jgi:molecular chaperone Hsp33